MIQSKYISDILELLLDGDDLGLQARRQIEFLTESRLDYTGLGVFVTFDHLNGIEEHRLTTDRVMINGLEIKSVDLAVGAEAMVSISSGLIDYLEIWSYDGDYPARELTSYTLTQGWTGGHGREIKVD